MPVDAKPGYLLLPGLDGTGDLFAPFSAVLTRISQSFTVVGLPTVPVRDYRQLADLVAPQDAGRLLRECPTKVLYLQATRDRLVGQRSVEEIVQARGDSIVCRVDAPHLLLQSAPEAAWAAMREHGFQPVGR